jgi:hypothetical protein
MRKGMIIMALVVASVFALMAGSSQAALLTGSIWVEGPSPATTYGNSDNNLTDSRAIWSTTPLATFTVDAINFTTAVGDGSYNQWLQGGATNVNGLVWLTGSSAFQNGPFQTATGTTATFIQLTGEVLLPKDFTIIKDDGFVLYLDDIVVMNAESPTSPVGVPISLASGGAYSLRLNYAGWNAFPEVLQAPDVKAVPIPAALLLVGSGLVPFIRLRKKR